MIESSIVIVFLCLLFVGLFQLAHAYVAREVLYHAAARAARAKTVGFNAWMVEKTMRVAAIPNAGSMTQPVVPGGDQTLANALATMQPGPFWDWALSSTPQSPTVATELARIPSYLASDNYPQGQNVLDYANWNSIQMDPPVLTTSDAGTSNAAGVFTVQVHQSHDLLVSLDALSAGELDDSQTSQTNAVSLVGRYNIEAHYPLYLNDKNW